MWSTNGKVALFASLASAIASPTQAAQSDSLSFVHKEGINYTVFNHAATGAKLEFVKNSGICETTPGVNQYSGYLTVGENMNMWFFEARNNPQTAPLAAWFNGGPGCSSMIGLFQENGPCHFVDNNSYPTLNEYSFNSYANVLYVDQPIGVGFSYGTDDVNSTVSAAPYVWNLLQAFYANFPEYESRDFGLFTESYGGHYGPEFADYILQQNKKIADGSIPGENIDIVALGINNGWYDSALQEKAYIDYAYGNSYRRLISTSQRAQLLDVYNSTCGPAIETCQQTGTDADCKQADSLCGSLIENPISEASDFDPYDVREGSSDPNPPETYATYLQNQTVLRAIGARAKYQECPDGPYNKFATTGDNPRSFLETLSEVVQSGITVLTWAGDADWICNWFGGIKVADAVTFDGQGEFREKTLEPYTVNGTQKGTFKSVDNFSFLKVFGAGHEVPYYQPEAALQVFTQTIQKKAIFST